jgi:magnesium chelatase family protein
MITKLYSAMLIGIESRLVTIEVDASSSALKENLVIGGIKDSTHTKYRIIQALKNSGYSIDNKRIVVNISPANIPKNPTFLDVPIALAIVCSLGSIKDVNNCFKDSIFLGELSLDATVRPVKGVLPIAFGSTRLKKKTVFVPIGNEHECSLVKNVQIISFHSLLDLMNHVNGKHPIASVVYKKREVVRNSHSMDMSEIQGQQQAKRALQIAVAGNHNIIMMGSPGSGKTMLAQRIKTIMPFMDIGEIIETSKIYSAAGSLKDDQLIYERPFRAPHHTISRVGLVGGGATGQPGEISLAHNGVLFMDELTEFSAKTIDVLRQPLEERSITISRAQYTVDFPASFIFVGAFNPCPCGYYGDSKKKCICSFAQIEQYIKKLSGPFLDRIDLQVSVTSVEYKSIYEGKSQGYSSAQMLTKINEAIDIQKKRNEGVVNGLLIGEQLKRHCELSESGKKIIEFAFDKMGLSMRGYHKVLRVSRTIADLDKSKNIEEIHLKEALMYRSLDKKVEQFKIK